MRMIVTGAASGIGRAVALTAASRSGPGSHLTLVDLDADRLAGVADDVRAAGAHVHTIAADLGDPSAPAPLVAEALAVMGGLDALVSNAGIVVKSPMETMTIEEFDRSMAVNVRATWLLAVAAKAALVESRGSIVATASNSGTHPTPPLAAYCASKAALIMLVKEMALEWAPEGIRCNTVSPGPTATGLTTFLDPGEEARAHLAQRESRIPLRSVNQAADVAEAILFLASPAARTITGIDMAVDGGISLICMQASRGELPPGG